MQATPSLQAEASSRASRPKVVRATAPLRSLALRERAILRLAARQGAVVVTPRRNGRPVPGAYERLDLCARLSERGMLRYAGRRERGETTEFFYEV